MLQHDGFLRRHAARRLRPELEHFRIRLRTWQNRRIRSGNAPDVQSTKRAHDLHVFPAIASCQGRDLVAPAYVSLQHHRRRGTEWRHTAGVF